MLSLHIASTEYADKNIENVIYIIKSTKRFNNIHFPPISGNIIVEIIDSNDMLSMVRLFIKQKCNRFFFCQSRLFSEICNKSWCRLSGRVITPNIKTISIEKDLYNTQYII